MTKSEKKKSGRRPRLGRNRLATTTTKKRVSRSQTRMKEE